jgi:hypothetical protein
MTNLFIYTDTFQDITPIAVENFKQRVLVDGGTFEAKDCLLNTINDLGGIYGFYDTVKKIDLFDAANSFALKTQQSTNSIN